MLPGDFKFNKEWLLDTIQWYDGCRDSGNQPIFTNEKVEEIKKVEDFTNLEKYFNAFDDWAYAELYIDGDS